MPKKYLLDWPEGTDDLQIEMSMIRKGGQWTGKNGTVFGNGLSFHYEQMRHLLWPHLDVHRWEELCRDEILKNKITVLMGPKSSGKTHSGSWVYLCEYLCFPEETCVLVSSTDFRGLELRVWGEIKSLFQLAKNRFPYLPGYLIDSKHAIATDDLFDDDAVRDLRKGMMGIPCVQNGKFVGLGKYCGIKQKRMRLIADEAALMASSFLSAFANLDGNEDFRAVILGNPQDTMDPLGRAAEPRDGWSSHLEPKKTEVWDTKFMGGRCVNLIGTDSPNFDFPASEPTRYKYLISREKIANTLSFFPKDSAEYYTQCIGSMKVGLLSRRVITREMCVQSKAMEPVMWAGTALTKIGGLDSAYGGDRCIGGHIEFGQAVGGKIMINVFPPVNVPVRVSADVSPEEQISIWVRDYCEANFIPPENFFHDSTGRGTLGTTLARVWSAMCNPVEFGGSATARPVALDFYVIDPKTHKRRLKLCNEHYSKFVTELWFAVSYAIQAGQVRGMTDEVVDEGCLRQWDKVAGDRIAVETKQDMKDRVGRSPDIFDWLAICFEGARRRGFNIQKMSSESEADGTDRSWWDAAASKANASKRGRVLALTQ